MSGISLRKATLADAKAIRKLIWKVQINPIGLDWRRFILAINPDGLMVGCGQIKPHADGTRELASLAVEPGYQRQGVGSMLIKHLMIAEKAPLYLITHAGLESYYNRFEYYQVSSDQMPPYLKRLWKLSRLLDWLAGRRHPLMRVMRWDD